MGRVTSPASPSDQLTIQAATGQGKLVKYVNLWLPAGVNAGQSINGSIPTFDDNLLRFFIGLFSSDATPGVVTQLLSSGRTMFSADDSAFSATHGPLACYVPCAKNVQLQFIITNNTNANKANIGLTLAYAVDDPNWQIGA